MSHPLLMVEKKGFAPDVTVDTPYAMEETLQYIDALEKLLLEKGMLKKKAEDDVYHMNYVLDYLRDNNFAHWPDISSTDRKMLYNFAKSFVLEGGGTSINRSRDVLAIAKA